MAVASKDLLLPFSEAKYGGTCTVDATALSRTFEQSVHCWCACLSVFSFRKYIPGSLSSTLQIEERILNPSLIFSTSLDRFIRNGARQHLSRVT
jgi:hypothetical protein